MLRFWKETRFLNHGITSIYTMMQPWGVVKSSRLGLNMYLSTWGSPLGCLRVSRDY